MFTGKRSRRFVRTYIIKLLLLLRRIRIPGLRGISLYELLKLYLIGIIKGTLTMRASSISFSFFLALFPFLLFLFNLIPFLNNILDNSIDNFDAYLLREIEILMPTGSQTFFSEIFNEISSRQRAGLLSSVFLLSIFFSASGINSLFSNFAGSYHVELSRNFITQYLHAIWISVVIAILILLGVASFFFIELNIFSKFEFVADPNIKFLRYAQLGFFGLIIFGIVCILYSFGTRESSTNHFFSAGALLTTILFFVTTYFFGIYVDNFSVYNKLYGSIGALLIFLVYIFINSNILLLGFELNVTMVSLKKRQRTIVT